MMTDRVGSGQGIREMSGAEDVEGQARRAASGDAAALDALLRAIQPDVLRQCARFLPNRQDAEEACQDALLQVARNIARFEGRSKFSTWLHVVVSNCARQTYRSLKRRAVERASDEVLDRRPDPRTTSVIAGSRIDLLDALEKLEQTKPDLVPPVVLRDLAQLTYTEIAEQLGVPVGTVKSRVHDGRKLLQGSLGVRMN
jgi:RNA polymerase sigma factor (sigma-70 family)